MKKSLCLVVILLSIPCFSRPEVTQEHKDRAAEIVSRMTLEEKIEYVAGYEIWYIRAVDRLGLPAVRMADGPQGVRNNTRSTLYPSGVAAAATWDRALINQMGVALGQDARARGVHILLGPGVNIYRSPLCGRNFEYFGEDPYLSGEIASNYIQGVQSQGVMACIKHFAGNNSEYGRHNVSSDIDERTLHEIYFPAFEKAVKEAGVGAVMTSYNLLNGLHASECKYLNYDVLRDMWGYDGIVMSDWTSSYSPLNVATWGVDLEMPGPKCMQPSLLKKFIETGVLDISYIDRKCRHIIQTILAFEFDKRPQLDESLPENNPYSDSVAHEISRGSVVMLKNQDGFLPMSKGNFFVCGPNADRIVTGGGSGFVTPLVSCSLAKGMMSMGGPVKTKVYANGPLETLDGMYADAQMTRSGVTVELFSNIDLEGEPVAKYVEKKVYLSKWFIERHKAPLENMSSRCSFWYAPSENVTYTFNLKANDGCRMFIDGEKVIDKWSGAGWQNLSTKYQFKAGRTYEVVVEHYNKVSTNGVHLKMELEMFDDPKALKELKAADCVIVCLGFDNTTEQEGYDRTFGLPQKQMEYLYKVLGYNKNVVVVLNAGGGVEMASWIHDVKAVLMAWYPGQQGGLAVSEIITGKVNPSGKLPISIEAVSEDNPVFENYHENVSRIRRPEVNPYSRVEYREGLFMGYRGYDRSGVQPLFPFGYGLSYTSFEYSDINITEDGEEFVVTFNLTNVGRRSGAEVAQLYVTDEQCSLVRPVKELKGFEKVYLEPGQTKTVSIRLDEEAFRFYSPVKHDWVVEPGRFIVSVGSSSADIRLRSSLVVK